MTDDSSDARFERALSARSELAPDEAVALARLSLEELSIDRALERCSQLICGRPAPPKTAAPSSVCGLVWKTGDIVYHCRTCGMDPSCAICHDCFLNSDHTGHDFWMFSSGGGCCDCGDVEAWKPSGFCTRHGQAGGGCGGCGASSDRAADRALPGSAEMAAADAAMRWLLGVFTVGGGGPEGRGGGSAEQQVAAARWPASLLRLLPPPPSPCHPGPSSSPQADFALRVLRVSAAVLL